MAIAYLVVDLFEASRELKRRLSRFEDRVNLDQHSRLQVADAEWLILLACTLRYSISSLSFCCYFVGSLTLRKTFTHRS
jgi:hypothetical protein